MICVSLLQNLQFRYLEKLDRAAKLYSNNNKTSECMNLFCALIQLFTLRDRVGSNPSALVAEIFLFL